MDKKYKLTDNTTTIKAGAHPSITRDIKLFRIKALIDIPLHGVKKGHLGGWIEKEDNLSQFGSCWVSGQAAVFENAHVSDSALVTDDAAVYENAKIYDNAIVYNNAIVRGNAEIYAKAKTEATASGAVQTTS